MMMRNRIIGPLVMALSLVFSCTPDGNFSPSEPEVAPGQPGQRQEVVQKRHVLVMVSGGHNSLSSYLTEDLQDIAAGYVPVGTAAETNALVVLARLPVNELSTTDVPVLYRMYKDADGVVVRDTLQTFGPDDRIFGGDVIKRALQTVRDRLPAKSYGMLVSSHASGWLPPGYYDNPYSFEPRVRPFSIGQDKDGETSVEMDLVDFAHSIPFKMEYIIMDCCLSGGVEVAYALKEVSNYVAFTQTETMADGFDYKTMMSHLLEETVPNPQAVCEDFYNYYMAKTGVYQSATISLIHLSYLDELSAVCKNLFSKYRTALSALDGDYVQGYFRYDRHYFYDLRHILVCAGVSEEELSDLDSALQKCVVYKAATPYFMEGTQYGFAIKHFCGLSMYLPSEGTEFLDNYYKEKIEWNKDTQLVI